MASTFIQLPVQDGGSGPPAGVDSFNGRTGVVVSQSGDYSAGIVSNTPAGSVSATTVQAAINELDSEKQATITGAATTIVSANLSNNVAVVSNGSGKIAGSSTTATEIGYVSGVTSSIQTQLDNKQPLDAELTAIAALASNGLVAITGTGTAASRTLTAGSAAITVTNGSGASGNPTVDLPDSGVVAGSYGSATQVPAISVNAKGKVTAAADTPIAIPSSQVTDFTTASRTASVQNALFPASTVKAPSVDAVTAALSTVLINPMTTDGDMIYYDNGNQRLPIGTEDQLLTVDSNGLPAWRDENLGQDFGDGSDGNLTVSGSLTLSQIAYYNVLTINAGAVITTAGYPLYCKVLDFSNAPAGAIRWNGGNGANQTTGAGGAAAGTSVANAILGGSGAGSIGGAGGAVNAAGSQAPAPTGISPANGNTGGAGAAGGTGAGGAGGVSRAGGAVGSPVAFGRFESQFLRGATIVLGAAGGAGGSGGGGDTVTNVGRGGGGGGGGAGVIAIYAETIITSGSTPSGVIVALGGNGGSVTGTAPGGAGSGGGGGGGGGGYVYLAYNTRTGPTVTNLIQCTGGNGGNGGDATTSGRAAAGGNGGTGGRIRIFNAATATGSETVGTVGGTGTAASGTTGGAGGNGGQCNVSL